MGRLEMACEQLPSEVEDDLSPERWLAAHRRVVRAGESVPETTAYIDLKNGQCCQDSVGEPMPGPLLATHDPAGGRGTGSTRFRSEPAGARGADHPHPDRLGS